MANVLSDVSHFMTSDCGLEVIQSGCKSIPSSLISCLSVAEGVAQMLKLLRPRLRLKTMPPCWWWNAAAILNICRSPILSSQFIIGPVTVASMPRALRCIVNDVVTQRFCEKRAVTENRRSPAAAAVRWKISSRPLILLWRLTAKDRAEELDAMIMCQCHLQFLLLLKMRRHYRGLLWKDTVVRLEKIKNL